MTIAELLEGLARRGIQLWAEDDHLVIRAHKGVLTPELRAALAEHKAEILGRLLDGRGQPLFSSPLSHNQRSLWFLYQVAPESAAYNVAFAARIRSTVDPLALRHAFQKLVDRHASLRTTYAVINEELVQQIRGRLEIYFEEIDASQLAAEELNEQVVRNYRRPFDLERGPVLRASLFTRSRQEHVLLIVAHHIACDGSSLMLLLDELGSLYPAETEGLPASLPLLNSQYVNYIRWQAEMLSKPEGEAHWSYWQKHLGGDLPVLNLPVDRPRPPVQKYRGASEPFTLSEKLTRALKLLAQDESATLYMILLAAWQALLHRYTDQVDILVGSSTFGRSQAEFARVIGHFVNPVVMRADLRGDPTFRTFLGQVRHTVLASLEHQDYPFLLLVERLQSARDFSHAPIFQVLFVLQRLHRFGELADLFNLGQQDASINFGGLELRPFPLAQQEGQFDLRLDMGEAGGALFGVLQYNTDLFEATTISQMLVHFQTLLESLVADPDQPLSVLRFLPAEQTDGRTVEDFPDAELSRSEFEKLIMEISRNSATVTGAERIGH